jgi:N-acetylglucosamine-6-phosphate deacetylase
VVVPFGPVDPPQALLIRGGSRPGSPVPESLLIRAGRIAATGTDADASALSARVLDADGLVLAPGFIDLQVNGAGGIDLTATPEGLWDVAAALPRYGVASFLPTFVTSPPGTVEAALRVWRAGPPRGSVGRAATPLGLHLEGPFLSPERRGVHPVDFLRLPDVATSRQLTQTGGVLMVTLAPELPGASAVIRQLVSVGVVVACGHSAATFDETVAGIDEGITYATHLFNAMAPVGHHQPGPVPALLRDPRVSVGVIADGIHVHPAMVDLAWRVAGPRVSLVSDATSALGMPAGRYPLGDAVVEFDGGSARIAGRLAGGTTALDACLRNFVQFTGAGVAEAVGAVTTTAARLLGMQSERASLAPGLMADVVALTHELEVVATIAGGQVIHTTSRTSSWAT